VIKQQIAKLLGLDDAYKRLIQIELKQEQRFPMLVKRLAMLESDVKALKMEHDILYAKSLKTDE
jgi:hypothetical protein